MATKRKSNKKPLRRRLDTLSKRIASELAEYLGAWEHALTGTPSGRTSEPTKYAAPVVATIETLVQYARDGARPEALDVEASVIQQAHLLDSPIYRAPRTIRWIDDLALRGIAAELADVCRAAMARLRIDAGDAVPRRWLASLAGVSLRWIKKAVEDGQLESASPRMSTNGGSPTLPITAASARRYLNERGQKL